MAGTDAWCFFAHSTPLWDTGMGVWNTASPVIMGQYPAYALMFRRGDVVGFVPNLDKVLVFDAETGLRQHVFAPPRTG